MRRREFLKKTALLSASSIMWLHPEAWAARSLSAGTSNKRLIVVFLRGAVDGLNVVVPHGDSAYYESRPTIAIQRNSGDGGVIDLDGHFGLHPSLKPVMPLWGERTLAFVHSCGSPDPTRSHFEAQDYMETGTPGRHSTSDGWMNRLLAELPGMHSATEAVNLGPVIPRILNGRQSVANLELGPAAERPTPLDRPEIKDSFDRLYGGHDELSRAYQEGQSSRKKIVADLQDEMRQADNGAPAPNGFPSDADRLARLITRDSSVRLAFVALGGWDTHVNQGAANGQLANHLLPLSQGLSQLAKGLGPAYHDTVIIVMSEFGRTVRENGNGGTDHGHGNVMWVMGGPVRGGQVRGRWNGLQEADLYQGRDLAVTSDFRAVIGSVLQHHMGLSSPQVAKVFPGAPSTGREPPLVRT
jgi:uncharacterized protein (DUF1501 family)